MNCYEKYDEMLKTDANHKLYKSILANAEEKLCRGSLLLSDIEACALADGMNDFSNWAIYLDYWDLDSWNNDDYWKEDLALEYVGRKLCELVDTAASREEIEKWYEVYFSFEMYRLRPRYETRLYPEEEKIFSWYNSQNETVESFAESLSDMEIHDLIELAYDALANCDFEDEWNKYQIVSQYIKSRLCFLIDQGDSYVDIDKWYKLNFAFNYS